MFSSEVKKLFVSDDEIYSRVGRQPMDEEYKNLCEQFCEFLAQHKFYSGLDGNYFKNHTHCGYRGINFGRWMMSQTTPAVFALYNAHKNYFGAVSQDCTQPNSIKFEPGEKVIPVIQITRHMCDLLHKNNYLELDNLPEGFSLSYFKRNPFYGMVVKLTKEN